jgi:hypothetical protein
MYAVSSDLHLLNMNKVSWFVRCNIYMMIMMLHNSITRTSDNYNLQVEAIKESPYVTHRELY